MVVLRIIKPYYHLDFDIPSKVGHIDQTYVLLYILYLATRAMRRKKKKGGALLLLAGAPVHRRPVAARARFLGRSLRLRHPLLRLRAA
jgi:hypothetical protein